MDPRALNSHCHAILNIWLVYSRLASLFFPGWWTERPPAISFFRYFSRYQFVGAWSSCEGVMCDEADETGEATHDGAGESRPSELFWRREVVDRSWIWTCVFLLYDAIYFLFLGSRFPLGFLLFYISGWPFCSGLSSHPLEERNHVSHRFQWRSSHQLYLNWDILAPYFLFVIFHRPCFQVGLLFLWFTVAIIIVIISFHGWFTTITCMILFITFSFHFHILEIPQTCGFVCFKYNSPAGWWWFLGLFYYPWAGCALPPILLTLTCLPACLPAFLLPIQSS